MWRSDRVTRRVLSPGANAEGESLPDIISGASF